MWTFYLFLFILFLGNEGFLKEKTCSNIESYYLQHLATKTPYRSVANKNESVIHYEGCHPIKIWMVVRHGTRNPGEKMISKMKLRLPALRTAIINNHNQSKGDLCDAELANLTLWSPQVEIADQKRLVHEGEDEMLELAERIQNRIPSLLPEIYSNATFKVNFKKLKHVSAFNVKLENYI